jgi:hypothetical protein
MGLDELGMVGGGGEPVVMYELWKMAQKCGSAALLTRLSLLVSSGNLRGSLSNITACPRNLRVTSASGNLTVSWNNLKDTLIKVVTNEKGEAVGEVVTIIC